MPGLPQTQAAIKAGARHATHTFNAMRRLEHRDPGLLGAVLTDRTVTADIIVDGIHVDPVVVDLFMRAKGADGAVLITDAISATGMPDGTYVLGGLEVQVHNGRCEFNGRLAGSVLTLDRALRNTMKFARHQPARRGSHGDHQSGESTGHRKAQRQSWQSERMPTYGLYSCGRSGANYRRRHRQADASYRPVTVITSCHVCCITGGSDSITALPRQKREGLKGELHAPLEPRQEGPRPSHARAKSAMPCFISADGTPYSEFTRLCTQPPRTTPCLQSATSSPVLQSGILPLILVTVLVRFASRLHARNCSKARELADHREYERNLAQQELVRRLEEERELAKEKLQFDSQLAEYEKYASLAQLALGAAHEINNPLLGIMSHLELELRHASGEQRTEVEQCIEGAKRISSAVRGPAGLRASRAAAAGQGEPVQAGGRDAEIRRASAHVSPPHAGESRSARLAARSLPT